MAFLKSQLFYQEKYLSGLAAGEIWSAFCLAEASCGSDPNSVEARGDFFMSV
jgi:alkylation response protein AidB-like acyl-CoA dehydrogenase